MGLSASATTTVNATPEEILEFVLDMDRYRLVDHKIRRVSSVVGPDAQGRGYVKLWGKLRWGPAMPDQQDFVLERWQRLTFVGTAGRLARLIFNFVGTFECEPLKEGTRITHAYEFTFRGPFRYLEPLLKDWLQAEIEAEVRRIAEIL